MSRIDAEEHYCLEELYSTQRDIEEYTLANERLLDTIDAISVTNSRISTESISAIRSLSVSGTHLAHKDLILDNMSLEAVNNNKDYLIKQFFYNLKTSISKMVDSVQYMNTLFNMQTPRLNTVRRAIDSVSNSGSFNINVGNTKYTTYGNDIRITDVKTYIDQFASMSKIMSNFNASINTLAEDDLFITLKLFKDLALLRREEFFEERFKSLHETVDKAIKTTKLKLDESKPVYEIYASDIMLGMSQLVIYTPKSNTYDYNDYESLFHATRHFYMYVDRVDKLRISTLISGSDKWNITKKDAKSIITDAEELLKATNLLLGITTRLSTLFATNKWASAYIGNYRGNDEDLDFLAITRAGRIVNRTSAMLYDSVSSSYNFSMGNVKKALSICESYVKAAS